jgi:sulfite dehydrogenase (cytochrome) subunit B
MRGYALALVLSAACGAQAANADESGLQLKEGAGRDKVLTHCSACHSVDYIQMNSPFPDRKLWETSVNKMIKVFGAPIAQEEIPALVDYLTEHYGRK